MLQHIHILGRTHWYDDVESRDYSKLGSREVVILYYRKGGVGCIGADVWPCACGARGFC